jgi:cardiolipin synthase C
MKTAETNALDALIARAHAAARGSGSYCARWFIVLVLALVAAGCATLPGANYPKEASTAFDQPEATPLGHAIDAVAVTHPGLSGFRLLADGADGLRARLNLAAAAQRTLDLQYFLIENDVTGKLLMETILRAADRGVRVRMLIDDTDDLGRNRQVIALAADPRIQIRVFNPFYSRGPFAPLRYAEILVDRRLNYRMHNKVFIADNAAAVLGGRNIGDEYFETSTRVDRADFDVLALGGVVRRISHSFDAYWNSDLAIPVQALLAGKPGPEALEAYRAELEENRAHPPESVKLPSLDGADPVHALLDTDGALTWARAELLYDNPDKGKVEDGEKQGKLISDRITKALDTVKSELLVVSPYLVPTEDGMRLLEALRARGIHVRIATNSLASTDMPIVHAGYLHYRKKMLEDGVDLYEVRPAPEPDGDGGKSIKAPSAGRFAVHAKVFVLDRQGVFVGSMNFDHRSLRLNTEIGLLIDSPDIARQIAERFDTLAQPANSYIPHLGPADAFGNRHLTWRTEENGKIVELTTEPMGDILRGVQANLLTLLPIDDLL